MLERPAALYEINTRVVLGERARSLGRPASLDDLTDEFLDGVKADGFDWVWLLGVWQTGPAGRRISREMASWREGFRHGLPDLREEDIVGSPFAIVGYQVDAALGGDLALARVRERLARRGIRLMLDFVPNHTACDHPWVRSHPEYYVAGSTEDLVREPEDYASVVASDGRARVLAHGRDPHAAGWIDTLQLNYRHAGLRAAMSEELRRVAARCDGVRCDMAMLLLPEVIESTWGPRARPADGTAPVLAPFWPPALESVRRLGGDTRFLAEVYWDLEATLQEQGFDFTYDKRLYDRLLSGSARAVGESLLAPLAFQERSLRFLENHDEARAAAALEPQMHRAAAALAYLLPGLRLFHEGQLEGRRVQVSMHLGRRPEEPVDAALRDFYRRLLSCLRRPEARARWRLNEVRPAWPGNGSSESFLSYLWEGGGRGALLVAVNFAPTRGQCFAAVPLEGVRGRVVTFTDLLSEARYLRDGDDLQRRGLFLDLPAWGRHAFEVS